MSEIETLLAHAVLFNANIESSCYIDAGKKCLPASGPLDRILCSLVDSKLTLLLYVYIIHILFQSSYVDEVIDHVYAKHSVNIMP